MNLDRLLVAVAPVEQVAEVVVRAQGRRGEVVLERDLERVPQQRERLLRASARSSRSALRVQRLRQDLGQPERLRDLDRGLDALVRRRSMLAREEMQPSELRGERREILVGLVADSTSNARSIRSSAWSSCPARHSTTPSRAETRAAGCVRPSASKSSSARS